MKYYIKAFFGDWKEVTKEKAEQFIKDSYKRCTIKIPFEEYKKLHYKEVV